MTISCMTMTFSYYNPRFDRRFTVEIHHAFYSWIEANEWVKDEEARQKDARYDELKYAPLGVPDDPHEFILEDWHETLMELT